MNKMDEKRNQSKELDMLEDAWGIICNVAGEQSQEWTDAMYRLSI